MPKFLEPPPLEWISLYNVLAIECGMKLTMTQAFDEIDDFYKIIDNS